MMSDANKIFKLYVESKQEPQMSVSANGSKVWRVNGLQHREDGPAYEGADGEKVWFINGNRHREDGPAHEFVDGTKEWFMNGRWHRAGGPAIERFDGAKWWYNNGKMHRLDGAAVELPNGNKWWFVDDEEYGDINAWAKAALKYENKEPTQEAIDAKIQQVMQQDLFS